MTGAPSEGMKFMEEVRAIQAKKKPGELVYVEELPDSPRKKWLMGLRDEMRKAKGAAGGLGLAIDPFAVHAPGVRGFLASPTVRGSTAIIPLHTLVKNLPKAPGAGSGISPLEKGPTGAETRMRKGAREQRAGAHLPPEQRTIRVGIERRGGVRGQAMMFPYTYVPPSEVIPGTPTREAGATRYVDPRTGHEVEIRPRFEAPALGRRRREEFRETRREFRRAARARDPEAFRRFTKLLEPASWKVMALYRANLARFRDASKAWNQTAYMIRRGGWLTPEELASLPEGTARDLMGRTFKPATIKGLKRPDVKALKVLGRGGEILTAQQGEQIVRALKRAGVPGLLFAASLGLLAAAED